MDLVTGGFLFLRHCVFELGGPLYTWQNRLPDDPKSVVVVPHEEFEMMKRTLQFCARNAIFWDCDEL